MPKAKKKAVAKKAPVKAKKLPAKKKAIPAKALSFTVPLTVSNNVVSDGQSSVITLEPKDASGLMQGDAHLHVASKHAGHFALGKSVTITVRVG